jgi:large subunit ribosomal protein L24
MSTFKQFKTGDTVKVLSGDHKGKSGKVIKMDLIKGQAIIEGIGIRERHVKPSQLNPKGGKKQIHTGLNFSKLALEKAGEAPKKAAKKETKK